jgi:hypothetical protein
MSLAEFRCGHIKEALEYLKEACEKDAESVKNLYVNYLPDTVLPEDYFDYLRQQIINEKPN